jgi:hypothetical protein
MAQMKKKHQNNTSDWPFCAFISQFESNVDFCDFALGHNGQYTKHTKPATDDWPLPATGEFYSLPFTLLSSTAVVKVGDSGRPTPNPTKVHFMASGPPYYKILVEV